ncbi:hypothetical protein [Streptomyces sp. NPDC017991]|uniref:hypothetical protein n=1 Tax=Streptomyces sp. NPDC017991 TaxID=3365026 RepID=UPI0037BA6F68
MTSTLEGSVLMAGLGVFGFGTVATATAPNVPVMPARRCGPRRHPRPAQRWHPPARHRPRAAPLRVVALVVLLAGALVVAGSRRTHRAATTVPPVPR